MSRIPAFLLRHTVAMRALAGSSARGGASHADPITRKAHVEERAALKVDERTDSPTRGTVITMTVQVITQLENYVAPGSLIEWRGRPLVVGNARRLEHPDAPSNAELWCVG